MILRTIRMKPAQHAKLLDQGRRVVYRQIAPDAGISSEVDDRHETGIMLDRQLRTALAGRAERVEELSDPYNI